MIFGFNPSQLLFIVLLYKTFQGKLKFKETHYTGFEQMPQTLLDVMNGKPVGRVVIKAETLDTQL